MRRLAAGLTAEQIASEFPELMREDVLAAAAYAADLIKHDGLAAVK